MVFQYTQGGQLMEPLTGPHETPEEFLGRSVFNSEELMRQNFPPLIEPVPGLLPAGLALLVAAPKTGKSWLALHLALALATGGRALGAIPVTARPVLYAALEDGPRRLQARLRQLGAETWPASLEFAVSLPPAAAPDAAIDEWLSHHDGENPLVIVDTLGKLLPAYPAQRGESAYERDYRITSVFHDLVASHDGATVLLIHHTRKSMDGDFLDSVSGTQGVAGGVDEVMRLSRSRLSGEGTLSVTGRDVEENNYAVTYDRGMWTLVGDSLAEAASEARKAVTGDGVGDDMRRAIDAVGAHPDGIDPTTVAHQLGWGTPKARTYLARAARAGRVVKLGRGRYAPAPETPPPTLDLDIPTDEG